jgi:hypothetical protein
MSGAGFDSGLGVGRVLHPAQAEGPTQQGHSAADIKSLDRSAADPSTPVTASTAAATNPTAGNAALNQLSPGLPGASARAGGGLQQTADGYGYPSGSTTDPASAANAVRTIDPAVGGQSPDGGQLLSSLAQAPLPRQLTDALAASGYNTRSSSGQAIETAADAQSVPDPEPSAQAPAPFDPAASPAQATLPEVPTTTIGGGVQPAALPPVVALWSGAEGISDPGDGASAPGAPETLQEALAATLPGLSPVAAGIAAAPNAAGAAVPFSEPSQAVLLGGVAIPGLGDLAGPAPPGMPTSTEPVSGLPGAAFTITGTGVATGTTMFPGLEGAAAALSAQDIGASNVSRAPVTTLDREAVAGLALSFAAPLTKTGAASSAGGAAAATPGASNEANNVTPIAPIPGSLTPGSPVPAQIAQANPDPTAEAAMAALPGGTPLAQTTLLPGLTTNPAPAGLANPMAAGPATPAGLAAGAWAYGFGPLPTATPQALLTPGIATSTNSRGRRSLDGGVIAYAEHRPVLLDLAPVEPHTPSWRLDDTQALVSVGAAGVVPARERAVVLYSALMEQGEGLAAVRPGEGFVTWDGSPLWLSLAGIAKPGQHGVLPNVAVPGRVQVLRTVAGDWLVEHTGRPSPTSRPQRHEAASVDDDSLLSDVLYGVTTLGASSDRSRRFERAMSALRFAFGLAPPARWRSAEAWASVARLCAVSAMQVDGALTPPAETALQASLSVVVSGLAPSPPRDALFVPPLSRERFLTLARSGDGGQIVAALKGLGRTVLDRLRRGVVDDLDRLDTLALAVCLGRLARTIPQSPSGPATSSRRSGGPATRSILARSVNEGRRW